MQARNGTLQRSFEPEEREAQKRPLAAATLDELPPHRHVLGLQHAAGNAAVAKILRDGVAAPVAGVNAPLPPSPKEQGDKLLKEFAAKFPDAAKLVVGKASAEQLVGEAAVKGVRFGGYSEDGPAKTAWAYTVGDTVYVPKARTDPVVAMSDFLFELNNAIRKPQIDEITKDAAAKKIDAKAFARRIVEVEVEGMLRLGRVWFDIKGGDTKLDKYDPDFFEAEYQAFKAGKKTKAQIVDDVLQRKGAGGDPSKTVEQLYMEQFPK